MEQMKEGFAGSTNVILAHAVMVVIQRLMVLCAFVRMKIKSLGLMVIAVSKPTLVRRGESAVRTALLLDIAIGAVASMDMVCRRMASVVLQMMKSEHISYFQTDMKFDVWICYPRLTSH